MTQTGALDALLREERRFPPPAEFRARSPHVVDPGIYERAERDPEAFWAEWAGELDWFEPWRKVLEWTPPHAKWFVGGSSTSATTAWTGISRDSGVTRPR